MRIRIQRPKNMRIHADPDPKHCQEVFRKPRRAFISPTAGPSLKEVVVEVRREKVPLTSLPSTKETILVSDDLSLCIEDEDYDIRISYSSSAAQDGVYLKQSMERTGLFLQGEF